MVQIEIAQFIEQKLRRNLGLTNYPWDIHQAILIPRSDSEQWIKKSWR